MVKASCIQHEDGDAEHKVFVSGCSRLWFKALFDEGCEFLPCEIGGNEMVVCKIVLIYVCLFVEFEDVGPEPGGCECDIVFSCF